MDLLPAEVVAPQFAVPIVGVILCALLVFAFGFKSPAQPPSFDVAVDDEERRKQTSKKRRAKELQKAKPLLNGHAVPKAATSVPKQKAEKPSSPKSKAKDEVSTVQAEAKESKKGSQEKRGEKGKRAAESAEVPPPAAEEDAEGGWVQQLSKKDRKTRRKEEEKTADAAGPGKESKGGKAQDVADPGQASEGGLSKRKKKKETKTEAVADAEQKPSTDVISEDDAILISDPEENPKDQRNKRKKDTPVAEPEPVKPVKKESAKDAKPVEEEGTESGSKSKAKKKKEKKKGGEEKEEVVPTVISCSFPDPPTLTVVEHLVQVVEPAKTGPAGDSQSEVKKEESSEAVAPSGSNVAFDELGDAWQDAKPQKKKKKVRKD